MPTVTVAGIIEKDGKILLLKRNFGPFIGVWDLPGGYIEEGEKAEEALIREVKEETDLDIQPKFLFYHDEISHNTKHYNIVLIFRAKTKGEVKIDRESSEFKWFIPQEALKLNLAFRDNDIIKKWLQSR